MKELRTARTILRAWRDDDVERFAELSADRRVMEHYPAPYSRAESDAAAGRIRAHFAAHGFGLWILELPGVTDFAGFVGLQIPSYETHFTPCVEVGWRLGYGHWNNGYATEGARAALDFAFADLGRD